VDIEQKANGTNGEKAESEKKVEEKQPESEKKDEEVKDAPPAEVSDYFVGLSRFDGHCQSPRAFVDIPPSLLYPFVDVSPSRECSLT
jgi:hypothetical protein